MIGLQLANHRRNVQTEINSPGIHAGDFKIENGNGFSHKMHSIFPFRRWQILSHEQLPIEANSFSYRRFYQYVIPPGFFHETQRR